MNVYDFDKTIYRDDSTVDFYFFILKRHPSLVLDWPLLIGAAVLWGLGALNKTGFKERFYRFLNRIDDIDEELEKFWDLHEYKVKNFYKEHQKEDDVVISASPEFLLQPICKRLGISSLLASVVDKKSGKYEGINCWGEEKTRRFYEVFGENEIDEFYSDSLSDTPLALIAKESYMVLGDKIIPWNEYISAT